GADGGAHIFVSFDNLPSHFEPGRPRVEHISPAKQLSILGRSPEKIPVKACSKKCVDIWTKEIQINIAAGSEPNTAVEIRSGGGDAYQGFMTVEVHEARATRITEANSVHGIGVLQEGLIVIT